VILQVSGTVNKMACGGKKKDRGKRKKCDDSKHAAIVGVDYATCTDFTAVQVWKIGSGGNLEVDWSEGYSQIATIT
jgi:hypothetical protein